MSSPTGPAGAVAMARWLAPYWRGRWGTLAILLGFTACSTSVHIVYPLVFRSVIDRVQGASAPGALTGLLAALGAVALGRVAASFYPAMRAWVNLLLGNAMRERTFATILEKDHAFRVRYRTGDVVTRLTEDIDDYPRCAWFSCSGLFRFLDSASILAFCLVAMAGLDLRLTALALASLPPMLAVYYRLRRRVTDGYVRQQEAISRTNDLLEATFSGIRVVKAFRSEEGQRRRLGRTLDARLEVEYDLARATALFHAADHAATRLGQGLVLAVGGLWVLDGSTTLGTLYAFYVYLDMLVHPLQDLPNLFVTARQAAVSMGRLDEVRDHPEVRRAHGAEPLAGPLERLEVEGLGLSYDGRPVLEGVGFGLERGERLAVVGPVGSGKSTLLRVLAGLLPPGTGAVRVNGREAGAWEWASLRDRVGYVPQEGLLFSETVRENVAFGRPGARVEEALEMACLAEEVARLPQGIETVLGHGGTRVSGGQRQRMAIARALAGSPDLLLLDDCTSSLDARNEEALWDALDRRSDRGPATRVAALVVTHRLATARRADRVLVLDGGRMAGLGRHEDLVETCPVYREFAGQVAREEATLGEAP